MIRTALAATLVAVPLAACGGGGPGGDDLPQSFRFTLATDGGSAPCFNNGAGATFTVTDAREAVPVITGSYIGQAPLSCVGAVEDSDYWLIACGATGKMDIRLRKARDGGEIVGDTTGDSCDGTFAMLSVEILAE